MAKRLKTKKKVRRTRPAKKTLLQRLLTIPKLAVYLFVVLSVVLFYQLSLPSRDVKGASTTTSSTNFGVQVRAFNDKNSDGKRDNGEGCTGIGAITYTINGQSVTFSQNGSCYYNAEQVKKCTSTFKNNIKIQKPSGYTVTGLTYTDDTHTNKTVKNNNVSFCGGVWNYNDKNAFVDFGIKKN